MKILKVTLQTRAPKISSSVDGGPSEGSCVRRRGSEDPHRRERNFGPSGVRALPLAAGINVGGHYFWYWSERVACASGAT